MNGHRDGEWQIIRVYHVEGWDVHTQVLGDGLRTRVIIVLGGGDIQIVLSCSGSVNQINETEEFKFGFSSSLNVWSAAYVQAFANGSELVWVRQNTVCMFGLAVWVVYNGQGTIFASTMYNSLSYDMEQRDEAPATQRTKSYAQQRAETPAVTHLNESQFKKSIPS